MEPKITILVALIGVIGGIVGGGVTTTANYLFGLETKRLEHLQEARRNAYTKWLDVRTLDRRRIELAREGKVRESKRVKDQFDEQGRKVMGEIATYGAKKVVESVAMWYRADITLQHCKCKSLQDEKALMAEITSQKEMRSDLMPKEAPVSDADMAILLLQCDLPVVIKSD